MAGHALRGVASAGLVLVVLETFARADTGQVGGLMSTAAAMVNRLISPSVPLIPDRRSGAGVANDPNQKQPLTAAQAKAAADAARNLPAVNAVIDHTGGPSLSQYTSGGGLAGIGANPALQGAPPLVGTGLFPTYNTHTPAQ